MFIQIQETPNPDALKFLPGIKIIPEEVSNLTIKRSDDIKKIETSPLAKALFTIDGVESLFFTKDFISITKKQNIEWYSIKTLILSAMMDIIIAGQSFVIDTNNDTKSNQFNKSIGKSNEMDLGVAQSINTDIDKNLNKIDAELLDKITDQIIELIDTRVKPAVAEDGGNIEFDRFENGVVFLRMYGACKGCPSSTITLKNGIENMLKMYIPEVTEVREAEDD